MLKRVVVVVLFLSHSGLTLAMQAEYEGNSISRDGISLKSPKADCPCCDDLTACPCDGIDGPSWFPNHKPLEFGHEAPPTPTRTTSIGHRNGLQRKPAIPGMRDNPRRQEESPLPPITLDPSQTSTRDYGSWLTSTVVRVKIAPLRMTLQVESGGVFDADRLNTIGSPVTPPTSGSGSGGVAPGPVPTPPPPPTSSKAGSPFGNHDGSDDSDTPVLVGPEVGVPLKGDVTEWGSLGWLPSSSSLTLYGHVLVGEMEVFDTLLDVELYGLGLGLSIPLVDADPLGVALSLGAGPGFLRTDLGDTAGVQTFAGIQASVRVTRGLAFVTALEVMGFFTSDASAWGPAVNFGLNISW